MGSRGLRLPPYGVGFRHREGRKGGSPSIEGRGLPHRPALKYRYIDLRLPNGWCGRSMLHPDLTGSNMLINAIPPPWGLIALQQKEHQPPGLRKISAFRNSIPVYINSAETSEQNRSVSPKDRSGLKLPVPYPPILPEDV